MRRSSAAVSLVLLGLIAVGAAEATLLAMLILFGLILKLRIGVELGPAAALFGPNSCCPARLSLFNAATIVSLLLTTSCGVAASAWKFRRWKPGA